MAGWLRSVLMPWIRVSCIHLVKSDRLVADHFRKVSRTTSNFRGQLSDIVLTGHKKNN